MLDELKIVMFKSLIDVRSTLLIIYNLQNKFGSSNIDLDFMGKNIGHN